MPLPKPFQEAAIDAACTCFQASEGPRRFLVADEVGLGKTVVAQQVIDRLAGAGRRSSLVVYYITSGQAVARQNCHRLVNALDPTRQQDAVSKADRLNLIPLHPRPSGPIALYALTPGTSFPGRKARLHAGRKEERAFMTALLGRTYPRLVRQFPADTMRRNVRSNWEGLVGQFRRNVDRLPKSFIYAFKGALAGEFEGAPKRCLPEIARKEPPGRFVGRLRRALARAVLTARPPDLVILDEFQRYRDMISEEGCTDPLVQALLEPPRGRKPALLMLSATPYKLLATRFEDGREGEARREFFDLLGFLGGAAGPELKAHARSAFNEFGAAIRGLAKARDNLAETLRLMAEASTLRDRLQSLLAPYPSRMEREPSAEGAARTIVLHAALDASDVRSFRHLAASFQREHAWFALPYWLSVPLPAQALGRRYMAWREASIREDPSLVKLTPGNRDRLPGPWPNPKLRALEAITPADRLSLPWVAPSLPWWDLRGGWAQAAHGRRPEAEDATQVLDEVEPKLLLFSRFKAAPQSVAALTSLRVEGRYRPRRGKYEKLWKGRRLKAVHPVMALFHPSPFLILSTDPLAVADARRIVPRDAIRRQLTKALHKLNIRIVRRPRKKAARHRPLWMVLAAIERIAGYDRLTRGAWLNVARGEQGLGSLIQDWHALRDLDGVSRRELEDLVDAALAAPGVIVGRALLRHDKEALSERAYGEAVRVAWDGLRSYFDKPVFWARLPGGRPVKVVQRACLEGNLEAVLDEHFWTRRQSLPAGPRGLASDLLEALSLLVGRFWMHSVNPRKLPPIRLRCHVAVPFGASADDVRAEGGAPGERAPRSDELRTAFNSPFWPHVLAKTSVGQEGLDFHTWCGRILHWDLCASPLDLEQREGRIQRFGGLAVRRELARLLRDRLKESGSFPMHASLWDRVAEFADEAHRDASGLSPWWVLRTLRTISES